MKIIKRAFLLLFSVQSIAAQDKKAVPIQEDNSIYNMAGVEKKPEFPGGLEKFNQFVDRNFNVPAEVKEIRRIYVIFVVEKDGSLTDIKVLRGVGNDISDEAIRVLKMSPKWIPGEQNGVKVRVMYATPLTIQPRVEIDQNKTSSPYADEPITVPAPDPKTYGENDIFNIAGMSDADKPNFPGGIDKFYKLFSQGFKPPADKPDLKGKILVSFVVEKDGALTDIKVVRDLGFGTGKEAVRIIKKLPKWNSGKYEGKPVRCSYVMPIAIPYQPDPNEGKKTAPILDKK